MRDLKEIKVLHTTIHAAQFPVRTKASRLRLKLAHTCREYRKCLWIASIDLDEYKANMHIVFGPRLLLKSPHHEKKSECAHC